jgi:hypothetical protein
MPSLLPAICNVTRAQKDALGCGDSAKGKHYANHVKQCQNVNQMVTFGTKMLAFGTKMVTLVPKC